ncbi:hypothetical protein CEXT_567841 [Caerostris extrusa]|uniref:Uncharacterized protein n=1 Tax=Caerostris extrusa TaxID=172846 RepID=A0AAV4TPS3_CAEEX|nr:hypothetical protein CEXT_567841 [Caerostris extrusa]
MWSLRLPGCVSPWATDGFIGDASDEANDATTSAPTKALTCRIVARFYSMFGEQGQSSVLEEVTHSQ